MSLLRTPTRGRLTAVLSGLAALVAATLLAAAGSAQAHPPELSERYFQDFRHENVQGYPGSPILAGSYGAVKLTHAPGVLPTHRATIRYGQATAHNRYKRGCVQVRVDFHHATGSVSWPPSGGSAATSDGWYRVCRFDGIQPRINLAGIGATGRTLWKVTVRTAYSASATAPRILPTQAAAFIG